MISGLRLEALWSGPVEPSPVYQCGMTTTQTCEALQQSHRLLGDTYIKQLPFLLGSLSHGGACETGTLCYCRRFCSFLPLLSLTLSGRHRRRHQAFAMVLLILSDRLVYRGERLTELATLPPKTLAPIPLQCFCVCLPLTCVQVSWSSPLPLGLMEDGQRSTCDVQL